MGPPVVVVICGEPAGFISTWPVHIMRTSFVGYLIENSGAGAVRKFLSSYDPERRDQAAAAAFHRPLGALDSGDSA